jgi:hypothetical protein
VVDPGTLGAIVAALAANAFKRAQDKTLDEGEGILRHLASTLKRRLSGTGEEETALARLEDAPDSPTRIGALAELLDRHAATAPQFRSELEEMVEHARSEGVNIEKLSQTAVGCQNVQIGGLSGSEAKVNFNGSTTDSPLPHSTPFPE